MACRVSRMLKYIQITLPSGQIDRYKLTDISIDDFLDIFVGSYKDMMVELIPGEYEAFKNFEQEWNIGDKFLVERYVFKHLNKDARKEHNQKVRQLRREKFIETFSLNIATINN